MIDVTKVKSQLLHLIKKSSVAIGEEMSNLTDAVNILIKGYGNGVGEYFKIGVTIATNSEVTGELVKIGYWFENSTTINISSSVLIEDANN